MAKARYQHREKVKPEDRAEISEGECRQQQAVSENGERIAGAARARIATTPANSAAITVRAAKIRMTVARSFTVIQRTKPRIALGRSREAT